MKNPQVCKHGDILVFPSVGMGIVKLQTMPTDSFSCKKEKWSGWAKLRETEPLCKDCEEFDPLIGEVKELKVFCSKCGARKLGFREFLTNKIIGYKCTKCGDLEMII